MPLVHVFKCTNQTLWVLALFVIMASLLPSCKSSGMFDKYPLITAVQQEDTVNAEKLLLEDAEINAVAEDQRFALMEAALSGHLEMVKLLVANGANVNLSNNRGMTALMAAAARGHEDVSAFLIDAGAGLSVTNNKGFSSLHFAASEGNGDIVDLLVQNGAPVNYPAVDGPSPLLLAVKNQDLGAATLLVENGADVNKTYSGGMTALHLAADKADPALVKLLLDNGGDAKAKNKNGEDALLIVCGAQYTMIMDNLYDRVVKRVDQSEPGFSAFSSDGKSDPQQKYHLLNVLPILDDFNPDFGDTNTMKKVFEIMNNSTLAIDLPVAEFEVFADQLKRDYAAVAEQLLEAGADVNTTDSKKRSAIVKICSGSDRISSIFKDKSIPVNPGVQQRFDIAFETAKQIHHELISTLINMGADVNLPDENGQTALMSACENGHLEYVVRLLENGSSVNQVHKDGWTPLIFAVSSEEVQITEQLLSRGADVNAVNAFNETALLKAVHRNNAVLVRLLMENGADPVIKNLHGDSPFSVAKKKGYVEIVEVLE